jgi:hypothetical protein
LTVDKLAAYVVANPWKAVGIAFATGALLGTRFPGSGLVLRGMRLVALRELKDAALPRLTDLLGARSETVYGLST